MKTITDVKTLKEIYNSFPKDIEGEGFATMPKGDDDEFIIKKETTIGCCEICYKCYQMLIKDKVNKQLIHQKVENFVLKIRNWKRLNKDGSNNLDITENDIENEVYEQFKDILE